MYEIRLQDTLFHYEVFYKPKRKSIGLSLVAPQHIQVFLPPSVSTPQAEKILHQKSDWLIRQSQRRLRTETQFPFPGLLDRTVLWKSGEAYPITYAATASASGSLSFSADSSVQISLPKQLAHPEEERDQLLLQWYRKEAHSLILHRLSAYHHIIPARPAKIQIRNQKRRWGSCSSSGSLQFNWRLAIVPPAVSDYVVVHELCHLLEHNHSPRFWQWVARFQPDYPASRQWLARYGSLLMQFL